MDMHLNIRTVRDIAVVELAGELDAKTAPVAEDGILSLVQPGCRVILDMSKVTYVSSAGLRMFLIVNRKMVSSNGRLALMGLSEEIRDTMDVTGFLAYFTLYDTLETGLEAFAQ